MGSTSDAVPAGRPRRLRGPPVRLTPFRAEMIPNPSLALAIPDALKRLWLPTPMSALADDPDGSDREFIEDDNRGAILPDPVASIHGRPFYLSVKGIGATVSPLSHRPLDRFEGADASDDGEVRRRLRAAPHLGSDRLVTGELWLRGSPYGGQGLEHAATALAVSQRAQGTSIAGFRIAPVVGVTLFPRPLEARCRSIAWYRRYRGRFVQELRLVPSNARIYFHARQTLGGSVGELFDEFGIGAPAAARRFQVQFVRTVIPVLTLFARTLRREPGTERLQGLEFHDVWLDKDAVVAPDGSVYFVDLEGLEDDAVPLAEVTGRIEEQIFRSLYEFLFAYEQIDAERRRRFGGDTGRRAHFAEVVREALREDPYARVREVPDGLVMTVRNPLGEEALYTDFPLLDH